MPDITTLSNRSSLSYWRETESPFRDNADLILPCFVDSDSPNRDNQIRQVAIQICPFLVAHGDTNQAVCSVDDKPSESSLSVKPMSGGLSNELFIVADSVLVRIHPDESVSVVDREMENRLVAWLSRQHMGPIFYGRFQNGRVEEFYPKVQPLSWQEMANYGPSIARVLADFHSLVAPNDVLPKPTIPSRYETVDQWVRTCQNVASPYKHMAKRLAVEWRWLHAQLLHETSDSKALRFIRQVVLTHMDCQSLNLLKDTTDRYASRIRLIDFEYAGWNPRAADIANTFCEHCDMNNIRADYEKEYPSETDQNKFLTAYLERCQPDLLGDDEVLATLRKEIGRFTLLSHLGWAAWSIVRLQEESAIEFDYVAYANQRMDGYEWGKKLFFSTED